MIDTASTAEKRQQRINCSVPYAERNLFKQAAKDAKIPFAYEPDTKNWFIVLREGADSGPLARWTGEAQRGSLDGVSDIHAAISSFAKHLADCGLILKGDPVMDGSIHRAPVQNGKSGSLDGAYVGYLDGRPAGWCQNHKTGCAVKWKANGVDLSAKQIKEISENTEIKKQQREEGQERKRQAALAELSSNFSVAKQGQANDHPYLKSKGIDNCDPSIVVGEYGEMIIPIVDVDCRLRSAQKIYTNGKKRYVKETTKQECFFVAAPPGAEFRDFWQHAPKQKHILLAEGYATAKNIADATNLFVAVAFDAGNLQPVAEAIHEKFPQPTIVVCADNDVDLVVNGVPYNKGAILGAAAAKAVGGILAIPQFIPGADGTDYNDLFVAAETPEQGRADIHKQIQVCILAREQLAEKEQESKEMQIN